MKIFVTLSALIKKQVLDDVLKAIQQINFKENEDRPGNTKIFFIIEEVRETNLYFLQETVR